MPECEAERRNRQAVYEMENAWGAGTFDYGKLKRILTGTEPCTEHARTEGKISA